MCCCCFFFVQNCYSDHKKAANLEAYVEWFNRLSYLVATEICMVSVRPRRPPNPDRMGRAAVQRSIIVDSY